MGGWREVNLRRTPFKHHKNDDVDDIGDHFYLFALCPLEGGGGGVLGKEYHLYACEMDKKRTPKVSGSGGLP